MEAQVLRANLSEHPHSDGFAHGLISGVLGSVLCAIGRSQYKVAQFVQAFDT